MLPNLLCRTNVPRAMFRRGLAYWNIEWKPAPYPASQEQRDAAAKRYGLLPEDYKPFADDGLAPGDYPDLEHFNELHRDPYEHYDYFPVKRNYNEPVPFYWEFYTEAGHDPLQQYTRFYGKSVPVILLQTFLPPVVLYFLLWISNQYKIFPPLKPKQFPSDPDADEHYEFDVKL